MIALLQCKHAFLFYLWFGLFRLESIAVAMAVTSFIVYLASMFYMICGAEISVLGQQPNIGIGSTLNTSGVSKWVSPSGEFAFGFFKTTSNLYLVGIWFDNIPTKTVVWTANRDDPVGEGSTLQLSKGGLELSYSGTVTAKKIITVEPQSANAAGMRDDGNFVLFDKSNGILWESFGHPTDTLLPGQVFLPGSTLFSKSTDTNYSTGRFVLSLEESLKLSPADRRLESYWSLGMDGNPSSLTFNTNGVLTLVGTSYNFTLWYPTSPFSKRVTLDEDGVLRGYILMGDWKPDWKALEDPCKVKGQCGFNGICHFNISNSIECSCPPGFDFVDIDKKFKGCFRNPAQQSCSAKSVMQDIGDTDWPGNDYFSISNISEEACKQACLEDCMCIVVVYGPPEGTPNCWKKAMPLRDGFTGADRTTFVKILEPTSG